MQYLGSAISPWASFSGRWRTNVEEVPFAYEHSLIPSRTQDLTDGGTPLPAVFFAAALAKWGPIALRQ